MQVTLVSGSSGGAFHKAEQLERCGLLAKFITTLPTARRLNIPQSKILLNIVPEVIARIPPMFPWVRRWYPSEYFKALMFGAWVKHKLGSEDIVVAYSMYGQEAHREARKHGAVTVIFRGSSHILYQRRLVEREGARWSYSDRRLFHQRAITRQLREYEEADYVLVNSRFSWDSFVDEGFSTRKLLLAPLGVDLKHFRPQEKEDQIFRIVCVGEGLRKGVEYLLEAVKQLALRNSELLWIGVSSPRLNPFLHKYRGHFRAIGKVANEQLYRYYTQASVVVVPSVEDGWCKVVNEAMACGVPLICTDHTGASDIVRDGRDGFVIPICDVEALKEKLLFLYEHEPERRAMGRAALERVKEFTWDIYGDRIAEEYKRILHSRSVDLGKV